MALSDAEVLHLAHLSKLTLSPSEIKHFAEQLTSVVDYFREINEVDTTGVSETSQTTGLTDVLREDSVNETLTLRNEEALSGASKTHNVFFVVPAILERNA